MEKHVLRFLMRHVVVYCDDVNAGFSKRFQNRLKLRLQHREITIYKAESSVPANAAQVLTPIWLPIGLPCMLALRPIVALYMPEFV
jgi:hypothetical protein